VGVNRAVWDLQYKGAKIIKGAKVDSGDPEVGPMANPGRFQVKLTVDGKTQTTAVEVKGDHHWLTVASADEAKGALQKHDERPPLLKQALDLQLEFALRIRDDVTRLSETVGAIRSVKKQLTDRNELLKDDKKAEPLVKDAKALVTRLEALEEKLHNPKAEVTYDILAMKGGAKLYSQLAQLLDWVKDGDGAPNQALMDAYAERAKELQTLLDEWKALVAGDIAKLNEQAKKLDLPTVFVPGDTGKK
jgi:hypothetical protein